MLTADGLTLFESTILKGGNDSKAEFLIKKPEIKLLSDFTNEAFSTISGQINDFIDNLSSNRLKNQRDDVFNFTFKYKYIRTNYLLDLVKFFIRDTGDENAENNKKKTIDENNALFTCSAARYLNEEEFTQFLDRFNVDINANLNIFFIIFLNKITPLFCSILNENDTLKIILTRFKDKIDINYCIASQNLTTFHLLCGQENIYEKEGCKLFLQMKNLKINEQDKKHFYSPLHIAIISKNYEIALILLNDPEIDVNLRDNAADKTKKSKENSGETIGFNRITIFEEVMKQKLVEFATILMKKDDLNALGNYTSSYVSLANSVYIYENRTYPSYLIHFFMAKTDDENIEKNKQKIFKENEALFVCLAAAYLNESDFNDFLDHYPDIDINGVVEDREVTPFICSILNNESDTLGIILNRFKDVDVNYKTSDNITALHLISKKYFSEKLWSKMNDSILLFFKKNPNPNIQDSEEYNTPLHYAVKKNSLRLAQILLDLPNINVNITNISRFTPLRIFKNNLSYLGRYSTEESVSILEGFAKHQKLQNTSKILSCFVPQDYAKLKKSKILAEQLFNE